MKILCALLFVVPSLTAQIHFGLKAGIPLTDITEAQTIGGRTINRNISHRWVIGPLVDLDLPANLGLEVAALYREVGFESSTNRNPISVPEVPFTEFSSSVWDFPMILKYRLPGEIMRPYIGAGWSYRKAGDLLRFGSGENGAVVATGAKFNTRLIKISPELRYTRWQKSNDTEVFRTASQQAEILVGLTF